MSIDPMLHYRTKGNPHHPSLLFLHGFLGSGADWTDIAARFENRYFCIQPDLPGHGKSLLALTDRNYGFAGVCRRINEILDELNVAKTALVGYSMGGRIALACALEHADRFSALILAGANPGLNDAEERARRKTWEREIIAEILRDDFAAFIDEWYNLPVFQSLLTNPKLLFKLKEMRRKNHPRSIAYAMEKAGLAEQTDFWLRLSEITMPVLFIAGEMDRKYRSLGVEMARQMPN
ncbi:MAG TPA: alpha/beta fold hydrolase, partial [Bacteroidetes bacterium]|nr:alpha/beta fold hydrolase [Bacteroidota bacterium]